MQEAVSTASAPAQSRRFIRITSRARVVAPSMAEWGAALATSILLIVSFPNFDFFFLAWIGLVPLLLAMVHRPSPGRAFVLGWAAGSIFFYCSCHWLTYSMINYGNLPAWVAYLLLVPGALVVGLFPGLFALVLALAIKRWGSTAVLIAPFVWEAMEWARLGITGQLWNAIGYSQAQVDQALLVGSARWGGVYAVGFLIISINATIVFAILRRSLRSIILVCLVFVMVGFIVSFSAGFGTSSPGSGAPPNLYVVAVQPNVPMTSVKTLDETKELLERHLSMSSDALKRFPNDSIPRLVVWPESPMNFTYASNHSFQELVAKFTKENHTSLLFNSLEPAPADGSYNSALLINEEGRLIAQYDKIRLMPFGEYVPLPQWLGGSLISGLVGEFTPGEHYTLMPIRDHRAGVFICIESAYPAIASRLTSEGATVLINISNDGYLGPTAVMRQHLANAIFRAVENGRPLLRVTNTGISASIRADGLVQDFTTGFQPEVRNWMISPALTNDTFYTKHGDLFVQLCALVTIGVFAATVFLKRRVRTLR